MGHKILGDSKSIAWIHEDDMDISTRKIRDRAKFLFYGPKAPKMKNGHREIMTCSLDHFWWAQKILGDSRPIARIYEDGVGISIRKIKNHIEFLFYGLKCQKKEECNAE